MNAIQTVRKYTTATISEAPTIVEYIDTWFDFNWSEATVKQIRQVVREAKSMMQVICGDCLYPVSTCNCGRK